MTRRGASSLRRARMRWLIPRRRGAVRARIGLLERLSAYPRLQSQLNITKCNDSTHLEPLFAVVMYSMQLLPQEGSFGCLLGASRADKLQSWLRLRNCRYRPPRLSHTPPPTSARAQNTYQNCDSSSHFGIVQNRSLYRILSLPSLRVDSKRVSPVPRLFPAVDSQQFSHSEPITLTLA